MQKFLFKDPRQGTQINYIYRIRPSYGNTQAVEYSHNPNFYSVGLTYLHQIILID